VSGAPYPGNIDRSADQFTVSVERSIAASPERIWEIIASGDGMRQWMNMLNFQPVANGRILLDSSGASAAERLIIYGRVLEITELERIRFSWRVLAEDGALWPDYTEVSLSLEPQADATLVRLMHSGFEKLAEFRSQAYSVYHHCWVQTPYLERLGNSGARA
jgi:uncharacterized protein YndB with AHSA1/START domain